MRKHIAQYLEKVKKPESDEVMKKLFMTPSLHAFITLIVFAPCMACSKLIHNGRQI